MHATLRFFPLILALVPACVDVACCFGQDDPTKNAQVAAMVNDRPISVRLVEYELKRSLRGRKIAPHLINAFKAETLNKLIVRETVLQHLEKNGSSVNDQQVDEAIRQWRKQLENDGKSLQKTIQEMNVSKDEIRRGFRWQLIWSGQLKKFLNEKNLKWYFGEHQRDFDGTELKVAHILLKSKADISKQELAELKDKAAEIRKRIIAKEVTFTKAAQESSESPSGKNGGELGWIKRSGPMVESFNIAAFSLRKGDISEPIVSPFGVHLIHCIDEKPGKLKWTDVEVPLRRGVARYILDWNFQSALKTTKLRYTENWPHIKPGTKEIIGGQDDGVSK